jgi:hypothetical protein
MNNNIVTLSIENVLILLIIVFIFLVIILKKCKNCNCSEDFINIDIPLTPIQLEMLKEQKPVFDTIKSKLDYLLKQKKLTEDQISKMNDLIQPMKTLKSKIIDIKLSQIRLSNSFDNLFNNFDKIVDKDQKFDNSKILKSLLALNEEMMYINDTIQRESWNEVQRNNKLYQPQAIKTQYDTQYNTQVLKDQNIVTPKCPECPECPLCPPDAWPKYKQLQNDSLKLQATLTQAKANLQKAQDILLKS